MALKALHGSHRLARNACRHDCESAPSISDVQTVEQIARTLRQVRDRPQHVGAKPAAEFMPQSNDASPDCLVRICGCNVHAPSAVLPLYAANTLGFCFSVLLTVVCECSDLSVVQTVAAMCISSILLAAMCAVAVLAAKPGMNSSSLEPDADPKRPFMSGRGFHLQSQAASSTCAATVMEMRHASVLCSCVLRLGSIFERVSNWSSWLVQFALVELGVSTLVRQQACLARRVVRGLVGAAPLLDPLDRGQH